ncbi:MAG: hypothetical protein U1F41_07245 [Burkholderiales bacterium]
MAHPDEPQRALTLPGARDTARVIALFAAVAALLLVAFAIATAPGSWFPRVETRTIPYRDFTMTRGTGQVQNVQYLGDVLTITATDPEGLALVSAVTDVRSADYPIVAWQVDGLDDRAEVTFLWRTDYAPGKVNSRRVTVVGGRIVPAIVAGDSNWVGRITGVALAIRGPMPEQPHIAGVAFRPGGLPDAFREIFAGWFALERWSGTSINTRTGGADIQELPLSALLVASALVTALLWFGWRRTRGRATAWPVMIAAVFVAAWIALDVQWIANLVRQVGETREQFAGKDWRGRHEAADDAEVFKFIERVRAKLPSTPARVFMLADAAPLRGRGAYYLYPHNVLFDPFGTSLPQAGALRPGDYVVVYRRRGVQYNKEARRIRFEGGDSVDAELILFEPGAAVFKIVQAPG